MCVIMNSTASKNFFFIEREWAKEREKSPSLNHYHYSISFNTNVTFFYTPLLSYFTIFFWEGCEIFRLWYELNICANGLTWLWWCVIYAWVSQMEIIFLPQKKKKKIFCFYSKMMKLFLCCKLIQLHDIMLIKSNDTTFDVFNVIIINVVVMSTHFNFRQFFSLMSHVQCPTAFFPNLPILLH